MASDGITTLTPQSLTMPATAPIEPKVIPGSSEAEQIKPDDPAIVTAKVNELLRVVEILAAGSLRSHPELQDLVFIQLR